MRSANGLATTLSEMLEVQKAIYAAPSIDRRLEEIVIPSRQGDLSEWDVLRILRQAQAIFFDTHVEVVSGHHTASYVRFETIAQYPQLITVIARDMARWLSKLRQKRDIHGIVVPASDARILAENIAAHVEGQGPLRVVLAPFDQATGRIGTEVHPQAIQAGESFVALNDVTTRGNCVSKLGRIITDRGGYVAALMVFARRDSGQYPLVDELCARFPFYYTAALNLPQWEPRDCQACRRGETLFSWRDLPFLLPVSPLQPSLP